jgi:hypothetical protein
VVSAVEGVCIDARGRTQKALRKSLVTERSFTRGIIPIDHLVAIRVFLERML